MHDIHTLNQQNWSSGGRDMHIGANGAPMALRVIKGLKNDLAK